MRQAAVTPRLPTVPDAPVMRCWTSPYRPAPRRLGQACTRMGMRGLLSLSVWFTNGGSEALLHVASDRP